MGWDWKSLVRAKSIFGAKKSHKLIQKRRPRGQKDKRDAERKKINKKEKRETKVAQDTKKTKKDMTCVLWCSFE